MTTVSASLLALRRLLATAKEGRSVDTRTLDNGQAALDAFENFISLLPQGHDLALMTAEVYTSLKALEGNSSRVRRFHTTYTRIEAATDALKGAALSYDLDAVNVATDLMLTVHEIIGRHDLHVTPGDRIGPRFAGAQISGRLGNGQSISLSLTRGSEVLDIPPTVWVLEGGLYVADHFDPDCVLPTVEMQLGPVINNGTQTTVLAELRRLLGLEVTARGRANLRPVN